MTNRSLLVIRRLMALVKQEEFKLKDGTSVVIRAGETADAEAVLKNGRDFIEDGEGQIMLPGEFSISLEDEIKWIESHRKEPTNLLLVAEIDGVLVGHIDFYGGTRARLRHTGHFGMGISSTFRRRGIGRALLSRLIGWARTTPPLEKIKLNVLATNARAISLYRSLGFVEIGCRRNEFKLGNGTYVDDIAMELALR